MGQLMLGSICFIGFDNASRNSSCNCRVANVSLVGMGSALISVGENLRSTLVYAFYSDSSCTYQFPVSS